jgi:hypothetical protein
VVCSRRGERKYLFKMTKDDAIHGEIGSWRFLRVRLIGIPPDAVRPPRKSPEERSPESWKWLSFQFHGKDHYSSRLDRSYLKSVCQSVVSPHPDACLSFRWTGQFSGDLLRDQIASFQSFGFLGSTSVVCRFDSCYFCRIDTYGVALMGIISHPGTIWEFVQRRSFRLAHGPFPKNSPVLVWPFPRSQRYFVVLCDFRTNSLISIQPSALAADLQFESTGRGLIVAL